MPALNKEPNTILLALLLLLAISLFPAIALWAFESVPAGKVVVNGTGDPGSSPTGSINGRAMESNRPSPALPYHGPTSPAKDRNTFWVQWIFLIIILVGACMVYRWYYNRRMTSALSSLKNRYEPIVELSNQLFYDYDVASGSIVWSGAILSVTGYNREEFQSVDISSWSNRIHPDDLQSALDCLHHAREKIGNYRVEYRFRKKDGQYTYVEDEGLFFPGKDSQAVRMLGTMKDISIRKKTERQLQHTHTAMRQLNDELEQRVLRRTAELTAANQNLLKSETQFRTIFEYVTIGMCLTGIDGRYIMVNRSLCAMLGYTEEELLSQNFRDAAISEDSHIGTERIERLLSGEQGTEIFEMRYRHKNGQTVWVLVGMYLLYDGQSAPYQLIAHIQNITRRKKDHMQVQRLHAAIEQAVEGVVITNRKGLVEYVNPAFERITGYTRLESEGQKPLFFNDGRLASHVYGEIAATLASGQLWCGQISTLRQSNATLLIEASISPIKGNHDQNLGYVAMLRDVTERQHLANRLKQAQKMEAIGTLAGGIAHDFNNILGGIIGCSEMALLEVPPESIVHADLKNILEAGLRAKSLIKQILTFSRQGECEMAPMDLSAIIKESVKLFRVSLPRNIDVRMDIPTGAGNVLADPIQMHQVVMNLCTNALHAMQAEGGVLEIHLRRTIVAKKGKRLRNVPELGNYVELTIHDTGCGIQEEIIDRVFDPFFTTKQVGEGTGLGLSVVHGIVRKHGGTITVESRPETGTMFRILMPLVDETISANEDLDSKPLPRGNARVLLVDDEKLLFDVMPRMLEELGYQTVAVSNGTEALEALQNSPSVFDAVLTDQTMSDMTGIDLSRRICDIRPDLPIILCTGFSRSLTEKEVRSAGVRTVLQKPVVRSTLARTLNRIMTKNKFQRTPSFPEV